MGSTRFDFESTLFSSEWYDKENDQLKPGAPEEIQKEFSRYCSWSLAVDIVLCIEATDDMRDFIDMLKENAMKLCDDIIAQMKALAEEKSENLQAKLQELVDEYNKVGHVPFKEKDKIYKEYHDVLDKLYSELHISIARKRLDNFKNNLKNFAKRGEDALDNERGRLMRRYEQLKSDITTYENNLGFLNASSKKGNSLIDEMNHKIQKLKDEAQLVREKIKAIDNQNQENEDTKEE